MKGYGAQMHDGSTGKTDKKSDFSGDITRYGGIQILLAAPQMEHK